MQDNHDKSVNARVYPVLSNVQQNHSCPDTVRRRQEGWHCKVVIATLNIGTLSGKGREIAAIMETRESKLSAYSKQDGQVESLEVRP